MRSPRLCLIPPALLTALSASCHNLTSAGGTQDSTAVASLVRDRIAASLAGDTARWHRHVSDSCVWTGPGLANGTTVMALTEQAANQLLQPAAHIHDLSVHLVGGIALATYVLLEEGSREAGMIGKRFRKTDTYVRDGASWLLVGAVEIAIPFRPSVPVVLERRRPLLGRYALGTVDSVLIALAEPGRLSMQGSIGPPDTLYAENDTTYFMDGDPGWWIFTTKSGGRSDALVFRMTGGKDVVYTRTAEP